MTIDVQWLGSKFSELSNMASLSSGGQKWVFSAEHVTDGQVVLKVIKPSASIESVTREILAVQRVDSDRVPVILEQGQIDTPLGQCFWFREQRIMGRTVCELLVQGPLDTRQLLRLGLQMLEALARAEQVGIVHRDVKPGNIICDGMDDFWLLDFGLARHLQLSSLTPTNAPFGNFTPGYAPPEQFRNLKRAIDARADLFGLGVTLYECATGVNPFRHGARDVIEIIHRVETMPLRPLTLSFGSANEFRDLVAATTQKRRDHRPFDAQEALTWMQDICSRERI